jgi:demethylmenaquinone methyltransferase/2-methoxy-6-polyprenyl-1,4-benzoquinol methylase
MRSEVQNQCTACQPAAHKNEDLESVNRSELSGLPESSVKKEYVRKMFDSIADRYDFANHLLSLGIDRRWRKTAIRMLHTKPGALILDVAAGTGDLSFAALKLQPRLVVGLDITEGMLRQFDEKVRSQNEKRINIICGDVEHPPLKPDLFDGAMVSFGVRNFSDMPLGLLQMHRMLKPGGRVVIVEFSLPKTFPIKQLYRFYFNKMLPIIGNILSRTRRAYNYLPDSVSAFPEEREFTNLIEGVGFVEVQYRNLTFGIATAYTGVKGSAER